MEERKRLLIVKEVISELILNSVVIQHQHKLHVVNNDFARPVPGRSVFVLKANEYPVELSTDDADQVADWIKKRIAAASLDSSRFGIYTTDADSFLGTQKEEKHFSVRRED